MICTVAVSGFDEGRIRVHEGVREDRTELLTSHLMGVGATSSPVALTVRAWADSEFATLLDEVAGSAPAELEFGSHLGSSPDLDGARTYDRQAARFAL